MQASGKTVVAQFLFSGCELLLCGAAAAQGAQDLYQRCESQTTMAEQRACWPQAVKHSEAELLAVEQQVRKQLQGLEQISPVSRKLAPVHAFDAAEVLYRRFRDAEARRVLTSYGSGNGGDVDVSRTVVRMNVERAKLLAGQEAGR